MHPQKVSSLLYKYRFVENKYNRPVSLRQPETVRMVLTEGKINMPNVPVPHGTGTL